MPFDFSEEDFTPKSKFDFTEEDFSPAVKRNALGESKQDLASKMMEARAEGNAGELLDKAINVGMWGTYLTPLRQTAARLFNIPGNEPYVTPPIISPEEGTQAISAVLHGENPLNAIADIGGAPKVYGPPETSTAGKIAEGATEAGGELISGLSHPEALETMMLGGPGARLFQAQMIKDSPQAIENLREAAKTGDVKQLTKAGINAAMAIGGPLAIEKGLSTPGDVVRESVEKEPLKPATEVAQPKEESARTLETPATVHGDLRKQPLEGERQVPTKESEQGVQSKAERGIQEKVNPSAESIAAMPLEDFEKYHNSLKGESGGISTQRQAVNDLSKTLETVKQIADAEKLAVESRAKTAALNESMMADQKAGKTYQDLEPQFKAAQMENQRTQFLDEAVRTAKARQAVEGGMSVKDAADNFGVHEKSLESTVAKGKSQLEKLSDRPLPVSELEKLSDRPVIATPAAKEPAPVETVLASQSASHGLPTGVPDRGPEFASELMEASRQLGALVRSRATLRPGVHGQFVRTKLAGINQTDRIEVGDIRNQKTVAHEIGHSLDGILFPQQNFGESQASLTTRVGTGTGKELSQELTKVSELMRGPMTGSRGHVAYRKRATELIADYFSLYAHDRDRAAAMAPKFTKGFESVLVKDQNTADVVNGIRSGNVIPKPPNPTLPKALAGITGTPPQPGTQMPGQVPTSPKLPPPARERVAAVAAEGLVKDAVRTFEAKVQKARIVGDNWRKLVEKQSDRNDVGAFVEGIGNLEKPGDTIDRVRTRMTPAKERFAKDYRFRQELERQEINKYLKGTEEGEYLSFLEDYLGHFYVDNAAKRQAAVSRWAKDSPHAKQRKLPTLKEAVDMGLTPITQDPAVTYELNSRINWQVATNRKFVGKLKDITTGGGGSVVVPAKDAPAGWPITNNPLIQQVYARPVPNGVMIWRGGAAIHPDVWRAARQILEAPIAGDLGKAYDAINGFTRANAFAFSLFHDLTLRSAAVGSQASLANPLRGLFRLFEQHPITGERQAIASTRGLGKELLQNEEAVTDAAQHGLKFSYTDSEAYQHNARTFLERSAAKLRDVPVLGKTSRLARDIQQWRQEGLWKNTHDAFKIITYHDLVSRALQDAPPGTDAKAVKEQVASFLNDAYGGQEWQSKFWLDPGTRKVLSRFALAPDWSLSTIRSVPGLSDVASAAREQAPRVAGRESFPTPKEGLSGAGKRLRFWGAEIAALALATAAAQYAIYKAFGDDKKGDKPFPWDNELNQKMRIDVTPLKRKFPWSDPKDPTRAYVNLGKRPQEILNWFTEPDKQVLSKASRPVAIIFEQVTGSEGDFKAPWKQDHESFVESIPSRAKAIGTEALPFTFRGNQFALSAPVRKGMTKYKAQQAYESVFELAVNPNRLRSLLRGQQSSEGSILEMTSQITDAAKRNGVPAEEVLKRSLSVVRGHHYSEFFKAFEKGDHKTMDEEAKALLTLGATNKGLEESVKQRIKMEPSAPVD